MNDDETVRQTHLADLIAGDLARAAEAMETLAAALDSARSRHAALTTPIPHPAMDHLVPPPWGMSAEGFPFLPRGESLNLWHDNPAARIFLAASWWGQEPWGVWGKGAQHMLRFALDNSYHGGYVDIALTVQSLVVDNDPPGLELVANGYFIGRHLLRSRVHRIVARIPPSCITDRNICLQLIHQRPAVPSEMGLGVDSRELGLGLIAMEIN